MRLLLHDVTAQPVRPVADLLAALPASPAVAVQPGDTLGPWTLEAKIGEGGMGTVFRAARSDGQFEQTVAIKFLSGLLGPLSGERFAEERKTLAALTHPNIARIVDAVSGAAGLHVRKTELLTKVATEEEAIWAICAINQLYRENAWYLERIYKWMERVGVESIRAEIENPERRRQLYDLFAYSQRFSRIDPWAERVAGRHAEEFQPLSRRMEFVPA